MATMVYAPVASGLHGPITVCQAPLYPAHCQYNSIQDAVDDAVEDDHIKVFSGTYDEAVTVDVKKLSITAAEGHTPVVAPSTPGDAAFTIEEKKVILRGLEIGGSTGVDIADGAQVLLSENDITGTDTGVDVGGDVLFDANSFTDNVVHVQDPSDTATINNALELSSFDRTVLAKNGPSGYTVNKIFSSLQDGVDAADAGDTVVASAGDFDESVTVDKTLTLEGPQAGNAAPGRDADEAVVGTESGGFTLTAGDIVVDGFTVTGVNASGVQGGINTAADASGYQIRNNIIRDNALGIRLRSNGTADTVVEQNLLADNDLKTWLNATDVLQGAEARGIVTGFHGDNSLSNATIQDNRFVGHDEGEDSYAIQFVAGQDGYNGLTISGNEVLDSSIVLADATDVVIEGNTLEMDDEDSSTAIFSAGNNNGVLIEGNTIAGTERGIWFATFFGGPDTDVQILDNEILDHPVAGIQVDQFDVDVNDLLVRENVFEGNTLAINNTDDDTVGATWNWWGSETGPDADGNPIGMGDAIAGNVNYDPWCVTSGCTAAGLL